ncbi:RNA polymerase II transcriptional coactivator KELP-like isoform X3 [Syzygium oleosum]|uniref:RNA polymerase II transcriptional coactivator KELP-like isoform X3 n=1 Tax=Syzygium oleosum TaxID=219896 RepID=UPI0024BB2EF5|nr:RNA polymerase II transcriptional coactivator KELP-like isoform X3 [Syzygium oleosum]
MELGESGGRVICELSDRRYVTLQDHNGTNMVSIRDYYIKDGKNFPSAKGTILARSWIAVCLFVPEEGVLLMDLTFRST